MKLRAIAAATTFLIGALGADSIAQTVERQPQGWTSAEWNAWYRGSQGSRLLPMSWIQALERPNSTELFLSDQNLARYQYLSDRDANHLPLGFVKDKPTDQDKLNTGCANYPSLCTNTSFKPEMKPFATQAWVGLNCSACHTINMTYQTHVLRIDGAPALADFEGYFGEMLAALKQTNTDAAKFDRFAHIVLGNAPSQHSIDLLHQQLGAVITWQQRLSDKNATPLQAGFGRLDAQGHILNKVSLILNTPQANDTPANAPASYPHIWDAPNEVDIQWNGLVTNNMKYLNIGLGALGRNVGEVTGVFGQTDIRVGNTLGGYRSSADAQNLIRMERQLARLKPPTWPAFLPAIDKTRAALGKSIYWGKTVSGRNYSDPALGNCVSCHKTFDRSTADFVVPTKMTALVEIGTDVALACNTYLHTSNSGDLNGHLVNVVSGKDKIGPQAKTATLLTNVVIGTMLGGWHDLTDVVWDDIFHPRKGVTVYALPGVKYLPGVTGQNKYVACLYSSAGGNAADNHLVYKARPLDGIWATAPYLHNGSVPTLYDLLLPSRLATTLKPGQSLSQGVPCDKDGTKKLCYRPETFTVGSHEYDPRLGGYKSGAHDGGFTFNVTSNGTPVIGNYNSGHNYGTNLNDNERWALVEYLKTL